MRKETSVDCRPVGRKSIFIAVFSMFPYYKRKIMERCIRETERRSQCKKIKNKFNQPNLMVSN